MHVHTKGRQNVHVMLEEGRGEWRFGLRKEFCLLSTDMDVDEALAEIPKEHEVENCTLFWEWRKRSRTSWTGLIKSTLLLLGHPKHRPKRLLLEQY